MIFASAMLVAMAVDVAIGWPDAIYRRIGHPVTWIGALIRWLDTKMNRETDQRSFRRAMGAMAAAIVIGVAALIGHVVQSQLAGGWVAVVGIGVLA